MRWSLLDICHVVGAVNLYKYWPLVSRRLAVNVTQVKRITSVCLMMFRLVAYVLEYKFAQETNRANGRRVILLLLLHCLLIVAYVKYTSCVNEAYNITQHGQCIELCKIIHMPQNPLELAYTGCPRRNVKYFGRVFLMLTVPI